MRTWLRSSPSCLRPTVGNSSRFIDFVEESFTAEPTLMRASLSKENVMTINRDSLVEKIRALMSKTIENGCTEHEALAALDKTRAMMDAYEVTEADLQLTQV